MPYWVSRLVPCSRTVGAGMSTMLVLAMWSPRLGAQTQGRTAEREAPEIREVRIRGTKAVGKGALAQALATQPSRCKSLILRAFCAVTKSHYVFERRYLDRAEFSRDALRVLVFYFRRGYRDAQIDTAITPVGKNAVRVTFTVTEGPPTRVRQITVADSGATLTRRDLERNLTPKEGEPLNLLSLDSSAVRLRDILWERGFADATVRPTNEVDDTNDVATVRFTVTPKRKVTIGEIYVTGADVVSEGTIRQSLQISPGELYRRSTVSRSQRALYETNLFRRAVIDTIARVDSARRDLASLSLDDTDVDVERFRTGSSTDSIRLAAARQDARRDSTRRATAQLAVGTADTVKTLIVRVTEAPLREARLRTGFTTADFVQADALFTHNYLFGGPRRLDVSLAVGNLLAQQLTKSKFFVDISQIVRDTELGRYYTPTYQASIDLRQRFFQSPRNTIGAGIFTHRRSSPGVFIDRGYGTSATFTRELAPRMPISANYRFEITRVEAGDVYFCINYGVCDTGTIAALRGQQKLSPVALTFSIDRSNAPFSPTSGILGRAELEHASAFTASDFRYNRAYVDVALYRPLPFRRSVLASHVRAGWVDPLSSTTEAVGATRTTAGVSGDAGILHPRKRFYAGGSQSVRGFGENQLGPRVLTIDPDKLRGRRDSAGTVSYVCAPTTALNQCDLNRDDLEDDDFQARPLGGTTLLEGGIELRTPVWRQFVGAVFIDGAILGEGTLNSITKGTGAITPGFGVRYESPVGPIRVDLGIRPTLRERLPVITQVTDSTGRRTLVDLSPIGGCVSNTSPGCRVYPDPNEKRSFINRLTNRLTLHLSIGQAF